MGVHWQTLGLDHVQRVTDSTFARTAFKRAVELVEIETFSYCNRRCWFCPNSHIDRLSTNTRMDSALYSSIIDQLALIDYSGKLSYSRYNEPLYDSEQILSCIKEARVKLPNATLHTNTNGDYLNLSYLEQLYDAGLRSLNIQVYLGNDVAYDHERMQQQAKTLIRRIGLTAKLEKDKKNVIVSYIVQFKDDMAIKLYGRNFARTGTDRGGLVAVNKAYQRTAPCLAPMWGFYVDYNGSIMPCCNFRSDAQEHAPYIMGKLTPTTDMFLAYTSARMAKFRHSLINDKHKRGLCGSCHFAVERMPKGIKKELIGKP